jgi:hypothetical protein
VSARLAVVLGVLLVGPALAGCASETPGSANGSSTPATAPFTDTTTSEPVVKPKTMNERWHFHDYWNGHPTIKLLDANVTFNVTQGADGLPALSSIVSFPNGVIVPAETGFLLVNATWPTTTPGGAVNLTYKPADSNDFFALTNISNGVPGRINTTESMCDVPHRQESLWKLNLTAAPGGVPPAMPPRDIHVTITATIGRPLFIDPPHFNWWQGSDVLTLVAGAKGDVSTAATAAGNFTLPPVPPTGAPSPAAAQSDVRVPVDAGKIVPEGAQSVVVMLNWTSDVPNAKLTLRYRESNLPSEGALTVTKDGATSRVFVLPVQPPQTDTTYSNRTTWEFHIKPDGGPNAAFHGTFTLVAWVTKLAPDEAVRQLAGGA